MMSYLKAPGATLDYTLDWTGPCLGAATIEDSQWTVSPSEDGGVLFLASEICGPVTRISASGGIPGHVYTLTNLVTLSDGRIDSRTLALRVETFR